MSKRKMIAVEDLKETVNRMLKCDIPEERRQGLCSLLESVLHTTGNYKGFNYVDWLEGGYNRYSHGVGTMGRLSEDQFTFPKSDENINQEYLGPEYKRRYY